MVYENEQAPRRAGRGACQAALAGLAEEQASADLRLLAGATNGSDNLWLFCWCRTCDSLRSRQPDAHCHADHNEDSRRDVSCRCQAQHAASIYGFPRGRSRWVAYDPTCRSPVHERRQAGPTLPDPTQGDKLSLTSQIVNRWQNAAGCELQLSGSHPEGASDRPLTGVHRLRGVGQ